MKNHKKIIITGSCGYLGSRLTSFLENKNHDLRTVDKTPMDRPQHYCFDLSESEKFFEVTTGAWRPDVIIHCATRSALAYHHRFSESFKEDFEVLFQILENLKNNPNCRLIYFSSSYVYSGLSSGKKVEENTPLNPRHPFGIGKAFFEQFILKNRPNSVLFRLFSVFGPGRYLFPNAVHQMVHECAKNGEITVWGEGKRKMQYVFMEDVLRCVEKGLLCDPGIYNVGGNEYLSVEEAAGIIAENFGGKISFMKNKKEGETLPFGENTKITKICKQNPFTPFTAAIKEYLA